VAQKRVGTTFIHIRFAYLIDAMASSSGTDGDDASTADEEPVVLVVDDEQPVLEFYASCLEDDYRVRTAADGESALVELDPVVDVVLLDRRMPGLSGDDVLEHITDWHADCRVAMVTAVDPDASVVELPFDDYLTKPVSRDELLDTVERLLLLTEYERLLGEYTAVANKCATLQRLDSPAVDTADLEQRCDALEADLEAAIADLGEAIPDVFDPN
jgi:DNA-binding response OmpR family regulator